MFGLKKKKKQASESLIENSKEKIQRDDRITIQLTKREQEILNEGEYFSVNNLNEIQMASDSQIGTREYQQDALFLSEVRENYVYGILCDGMGGMQEGDKVSIDTVAYFADYLDKLEDFSNIPGVLENLINEINEIILKKYSTKVAGTTLVTVILHGNKLYWASVGDSRIYILRGEEIVQMTRDHNYAMKLKEMVVKGKLKEEEIQVDPQKDALISYIGAPELEVVDVGRSPFLMMEGDSVLLCSDGLTKSLTDDQILQIVNQYKQNALEAVHVLTAAAFDEGNGSKDNTSVILIKYPFWK